jgi:hypothetical protein
LSLGKGIPALAERTSKHGDSFKRARITPALVTSRPADFCEPYIIIAQASLANCRLDNVL